MPTVPEPADSSPWELTVSESHEWDSCADYLAARGLTGKTGDPLPPLVSSRVIEEIANYPEEFRDTVRRAAYARAMNALNIPEED